MSDRVWFDACIRPNAAMSRRGLALVGAALMAPALIFGVIMLVYEAWPATLFLGAEAALAVIALYWCAKRLSEQWERVLLTDNSLVVEAWDKGKPIATQQIDPTWVSIERRVSSDFGCEAVFLRVRRRRVRIAQALNPKERVALADALEHALHQRKTGFAVRAA